MSYRKIPNLDADPRILTFRWCYALEKVDGTSAHVAYRDDRLWLSSGGADRETFVALFDQPKLLAAFRALGHPSVAVHGEAHGGTEQQQWWRYGRDLRFVAFEVNVGEHWLAVPQAADVCGKLGLEFVHYVKVSTDLEALDAERDAPSVQAVRNGVVGDKPREGVVLRPPFEVRLNNGERVAAKYKRPEERETATQRMVVVDPDRTQVLEDAQAVADEWVTPLRLGHVLQKLPRGLTVRDTGAVTEAVVADVLAEGVGQVADTREVRKAVGTAAAKLFQGHLRGTVSVHVEE